MVEVRIEEHAAFSVAGRKVWISGQDNSQFDAFWARLHADGTVDKLKSLTDPSTNVTASRVLGVSRVEKDPDNRAFYFWIVSECDGFGDFETYTVPGGKWAIFRNTGSLPMSLVDAEMYAFLKWLPSSPYRHALAPELEVYPAAGDDIVEFWLPIVDR